MLKLTEKLKKLKDRLFNVEYYDPGKWYFADTNILDIEGNDFLMNRWWYEKHMHISISATIFQSSLSRMN